MKRQDYIFQEKNGQLELVGDFDGLYKSEKDPWEQSGKTGKIGEYYLQSRARLFVMSWSAIKSGTVLEVGCGHGLVTNTFNNIMDGMTWEGLDISPTAIEQARKLHPKCVFHVGDVTKFGMGLPVGKRYDMIVFNQVLWYILHAMDGVVANCYNRLVPGGRLLISQAYLRHQRYGTNIANGFHGTLDLFRVRYSRQFRLIEARYDDTDKFIHHDGLLLFRRQS